MIEEGGMVRLGGPELLPRSEYYERIGSLQQRLRESERKRMELESKLFDASRLDMCRAHRRYVKLKQSLQEICEREKRARLRNQEFLRDFDQIEAQIMTLRASKQKLQNLKMLQVAKQAGINNDTNMSRELYHPATIFMGRQMSATSSTEHFSTQQNAFTSTKTYSISDPYSFKLATKNGRMTDSCVIETNSDIQGLNNTEKVYGKTSWQISEKMPLTSTLSTENGRTPCSKIENSTSIQSNLVEIKQPASPNSQLQERLISENGTKDLKSSNIMSTMEEDALGYKNLVVTEDQDNLPSCMIHDSRSEPSLNKCHLLESLSENNKNLETLWPLQITEQLNKNSLDSDSSSDLTVSLSDTEEISATRPLQIQGEEESLPEVLRSIPTENEKEVEPNRGNSSPLCIISGLATEEGSLATSSTSQDCLSIQGFFHLVQSIEDMVLAIEPKCLELYKSTNINTVKLKEIICLCNRTKALKEEDLETYTAVVLHQSMLNGCLLPEDIHIDSSGVKDEKQMRSWTDFSILWERLCKHAIFLKEYNILSKDVISETFGSLLMVPDNQENSKTKALLKRALEEERDFPIHRSESLCSLSSTLNDNCEIKPENQAWCLDSNKTREQGLNPVSSNSKTKVNNRTGSEASFSSCEESPLLRNDDKWKEMNKKSKAFWGESDDSNSEIEAALRPHNQDSDPDDFEDFYK
ncbi:centrosomal protein kizuna isoform X2 [Microcaecilia unicolor]|uniref:Centrosomal protein kizuna n=1 Tax=Microcaecilia unicolor TaxID=1415580 RepID=A0A6P7XN68_9AMPH|nr:centrosomal protein kizuna isoform X2 [Microcaecilia unicolor]